MCRGVLSLPVLSQAASLPRPGASLVRHPVSQASETQVLNPWSWSPAALRVYFLTFFRCGWNAPRLLPRDVLQGWPPQLCPQGLDPLWASAVGCLLILGGAPALQPGLSAAGDSARPACGLDRPPDLHRSAKHLWGLSSLLSVTRGVKERGASSLEMGPHVSWFTD